MIETLLKGCKTAEILFEGSISVHDYGHEKKCGRIRLDLQIQAP